MHYESIQEHELALKNYEKRLLLDGPDTEVFYSYFRIGVLQKELKCSSEIFINSLLKAFQIRHWRAEPLFTLVCYFMEIDAYFLGYLITKFAMSAPLFNDYYLVIHRIYEYELFSQFAECSFRCIKYHDAIEGVTRLLAVASLPEDIREASKRNLALLQCCVKSG